MIVYIYRADIYCEECGESIRQGLISEADTNLFTLGKLPTYSEIDSDNYDSDQYPKGPYPDGGGEADTPQHCGGCCVFLENPLTADGIRYVRENNRQEWLDYYEIETEKDVE